MSNPLLLLVSLSVKWIVGWGNKSSLCFMDAFALFSLLVCFSYFALQKNKTPWDTQLCVSLIIYLSPFTTASLHHSYNNVVILKWDSHPPSPPLPLHKPVHLSCLSLACIFGCDSLSHTNDLTQGSVHRLNMPFVTGRVITQNVNPSNGGIVLQLSFTYIPLKFRNI